MNIKLGLIGLAVSSLMAPTVLAGGGLIELGATYPSGGNIASPGQTVTITAKVHLTNDKLPDDPENLCKQCKVELKIREQIADTQISQESDKTNDNGEITGHVRVNNQHIVYFYAEAHLPNGQSYTSYEYVLDFDGPIIPPSPSLAPSIKPVSSSIKPAASIKASAKVSPYPSASPKTVVASSSVQPVPVPPRTENTFWSDFIEGIKSWFRSLLSFGN